MSSLTHQRIVNPMYGSVSQELERSPSIPPERLPRQTPMTNSLKMEATGRLEREYAEYEELPPEKVRVLEGGMVEARAQSLSTTQLEEAADPQRKRAPYEPPSIQEILRKLRRDSGAFGFIPLSTGKYLADVWWLPQALEVMEPSAKATVPEPWLLLSVLIFVDSAGQIPDVRDGQMSTKFRASPEDILKICFLRTQFVNKLHSERAYSDFDKWYVDMCQACRKSECSSHASFAKKVFDYCFAAVITRIPRAFKLAFSKRSHVAVREMASIGNKTTNMNSVLCVAEGKTIFYYEFRIRIILTDEDERGEQEERSGTKKYVLQDGKVFSP